MRTPGLGLSRLNSTRGVLPIAWTMSPYFPPHGRLPRPGSIIASESVVGSLAAVYPGAELCNVVPGQTVLHRPGHEQIQVVAGRRALRGLLVDHLVGQRAERPAVEQHLELAAPVREPGALLAV